MNALTRRGELAAFLRSRRQGLDPRVHGLEPGRRRGSGLRREEVATIAGVSVTWYTWLEQARDIHPSAEVLASIGRALQLGEAEREYLLRLGGHSPPTDPLADRPDPHRDPQLQALADAFLPNPASIVTPSFDYVAWNRSSEQLVPGFLGCTGDGVHNLVRFVFSGEAERNSVKAPETGVPLLVARLRANAARHLDDPGITMLAEELSDTSPEFARLWPLQQVAPSGPPPEVKLLHPDAGPLRFQEIRLAPELHPDLTLVVFLPSDEGTATALRALQV